MSALLKDMIHPMSGSAMYPRTAVYGCSFVYYNFNALKSLGYRNF